jgi:hypothetical protein
LPQQAGRSRAPGPRGANVEQRGQPADQQHGSEAQWYLGQRCRVPDQGLQIVLDAGSNEEDRDQEAEANALQRDLELSVWLVA